MDHASRYLVAVPLVDIRAKESIKAFLDNYLLIYGVPNNIHTDRGTVFTSKLFSEMCKVFGINKSLTISYNPTGNAYLERRHGIIKSLLRAKDNNWVENLNFKVFFYNISTCKSTGFSPYELFFGRLAQASLPLFGPKLPDREKFVSNFDYLV